MSNKMYFITKLSFRDNEHLIKDVFVYVYDGENISAGEVRTREWLVNRAIEGSSIYILSRSQTEHWQIGQLFIYKDGLFSWGERLPENITKRKTFVSYYHGDDQDYRTYFENLFSDLIVSKSVEDGDIDSDNSDDYIKELIQKEYLRDTTVLVVLVGAKTKCRKHVDWEISGAISTRVGGNSGLIGILLPTHPDFGKGNYNAENLPKRLAKNIESGYAKLYDWTEDRAKMQEYIETAFLGKDDTDKRINSTIPQMLKNSCE